MTNNEGLGPNRATRRRLKRSSVRAQIAEQVIGPDWLVEIELDSGAVIYLRPGSVLDQLDINDEGSYGALVKAAKTPRDLALVALGQAQGVSAEEQLALWEADGGTLRELMMLYQAEGQELNERLGNLRLSEG